MTKVNPDNENETKSHIFHGTYLNLTLFFNAKVKTNKYIEIKLNKTCANLTVFLK